MRCVEACPAKALKGNMWYPGVPREEILDVRACDQWKKEHYYRVPRRARLWDMLSSVSLWIEGAEKKKNLIDDT